MILEGVRAEIAALQHKDRLDEEDWKRLADLNSELKKSMEKPNPEPIKNVYNEMVAGIMGLVRPNGTWKGNPAKEWHDLRKQVVEFIFEKKREKDGKEKV